MSRPTVLLVEDDASIRRFVGMALDDMAVDLVQKESVAEALAWLATQSADLVLTDLSLSDGSGLRLLRWLADHASSRVAVFSAGVTSLVAQEIAQIGVWQVLHKPVPLAQLRACVRDGTAVTPPAGTQWSGPDLLPDGDVVRRFFAGDRALFDTYSASCRTQFARDVEVGNRAARAGDLGALRRLAHSVHTVLEMLGYPAEADVAQELEDAAVAGHAENAVACWLALRAALARMAA